MAVQRVITTYSCRQAIFIWLMRGPVKRGKDPMALPSLGSDQFCCLAEIDGH